MRAVHSTWGGDYDNCLFRYRYVGMSRLPVSLVALLLLGLAPATSKAPRVFAFYYLWYGTPEHDGRYLHWDHHVLPHWTEAVRQQYPEAAYIAPDDIHAPFYPARGLYSSRDPLVLQEHMQQMVRAGIDVAVASWWGRPNASTGDSQGVVTDALFPALLDAAAAAGVRVAFHLEPYPGRSAQSIREDLAYLVATYGHHPALLRLRRQQHRAGSADGVDDASPSAPCVPVYFVYDSYHIGASDWAGLLGDAAGGEGQPPSSGGEGQPPSSGGEGQPPSSGGEGQPPSSVRLPPSVRGTPLDGFFIGLWLDASHGQALADGGFDGAYPYFATDGFSHGSTRRHWPAMAAACENLGLLWVPSVAPGRLEADSS
jgi:glycoprotein endo-alpha-1,2-mannosidase